MNRTLAASDFAALADAAWPALEREPVCGWEARFASGFTKRANSAWARGAAADTSPAALAAVEARYRARELVPTFQLTDDGTAAALLGRGGPAELEIARRILTGTPALYAATRSDGVVVSVARLALVGSWGGLYCVGTLGEHRRRGHSARVIESLLAAGRDHGVTDAWLQVLEANSGAVALYSGRFGFGEVGRYRYLVG